MKLYIVGIVGSGKTTLARSLAQEWNYQWYELDEVVHDRDRGKKRTPEEQWEYLREIDSQGDWILEGVYRESYHLVLDLADLVLFLDPPLWKRKWHIFFRFLRQQLGMERSGYSSDWKMLRAMYRWTRDFERNRPVFETMLAAYANKLIVARRYISPEEAEIILSPHNMEDIDVTMI